MKKLKEGLDRIENIFDVTNQNLNYTINIYKVPSSLLGKILSFFHYPL